MIKSRKKVVFVINDITAKGGEERMCSIIANYLNEHGYDVSIFSLVSHNGRNPFFKISDDIQIIHLLGLFIERRVRQYLPWLNYLRKKLRWFLTKLNPDIIIDVEVAVTPLTCKASEGLGIKHISWDHFPYINHVEIMPRLIPYLRTVDKIVVLTNGNKKSYIEDSQISPLNVVQISNPSPIELCTYTSHSDNVVLAMGRLEYLKGFDRLLNIWARIEPQMPDWKLKIVGSGGYERALKEQANLLGLCRVNFYPHTSSPIEQYKGASIFVLTSRLEGYGLVLLEALNMSLPIVSYDCENGPREILVDGYNGYLVPDGDAEMFVDKLLQLMQDGQLRNKFGNNAIISASKFSLENIGQQWLELLESI